MKYKAVIRFKDKGGNTKEESVQLSAQNEQDAKFQYGINEEIAEKKYGKANVISVTLHEMEKEQI
jgi:hypothetical protein